MKWAAMLLVFLSWALAGTGILFWLFGSMFNDSPNSAPTFQRIINGWPNLIMVAIQVSIAVFVLKDPKWRLIASALGAVISLVMFMRPFSEISAYNKQQMQEANDQLKAMLEEIRLKIVNANQVPLEGEELAQTSKTLYTLVDSQGDAAIEVLRLALKNGVFPIQQTLKDKNAFYPGGETKPGEEPLLNRIVYSKASVLKTYLEAGADPNQAETAFGLTPLMVAASLEQDRETLEKVKLLLQFGARAQSKDSLGKTARDHALFTKEETARELEEFKGKNGSYENKRRQELEERLRISDEILSLLGS